MRIFLTSSKSAGRRSRAIAVLLAPALVLAGLGVSTPVARAAVGHPPAIQSQPVLPHTTVAMPARPSTPAPTTAPRTAIKLPAAGFAEVAVTAAGAGRPAARLRAGTLPVSLALAARQPATARFRVHLLAAAQARQAGVTGLVFSVTPSPTSIAPVLGQLSVGLDYSAFSDAIGADFGSRLQLVQLPACALTTPAVAACQRRTPLPSSVNSLASRTVAATVPLTPPVAGRQPVTVLAAVSGPSGSQGAFTATSLAPSGSWSVSGASGAFNWAYPITTPTPGTGADVAPAVSLSYSSAAVDGRISSTNNQSSWIGEGWDYQPGFIERTYRSCTDDPAGTAPKTGDLCWAGQIVTLSLGGQSTSLVRDDTTGQWHPSTDNGQKVELLTGASNPAHDGEYWRITTTDGVKYYFGLNRAPGSAATDATNSTWTVPVYGAHAGDPCNNAAGFAQSSCAQAWRWNLDYVEDPHGNAAVYSYAAETNYYGANLGTTGVGYTRAGTLREIDYGLAAVRRVGLRHAGRREGSVHHRAALHLQHILLRSRQFTAANASYWPDTPQDQQCLQGAYLREPRADLLVDKRLTTIETQYLNGAGYSKLDILRARPVAAG